MATLASAAPSARGDEKFFLVMAWIMSVTIIAGFATNLALGRSSFAVPLIYHLHAGVFLGWIVIYLIQNFLAASGNIVLHRRLGMIALIWVPLMVIMGMAMMIVSMRRIGGPFFFDQNEFLVSNLLHLLCFGGLMAAAMIKRRQTDWHRRLAFIAFSILTGPGFGRLLPMPLVMPFAWKATVAATLIFPLIGLIADKRRTGTIHPAWLFGIGAVILTQIVGDLIAYSDWGVAVTKQVLAGTPGAERPMYAYLPF